MTQNNLMEKTDTLVKEYGTKWKAIAEMLHSEGFAQDDGSPLTVDTLRKRYKKWVGHSEVTANPGNMDSRENSDPEGSKAFNKSPGKTEHTEEAMIPVSKLLDLFRGTIERRDEMLAQKLKSDDDKQYGEDRMRSMEARLEKRLLKRLKEELIDFVEDSVDRELKIMLTPGGSFERELKLLVNKLIEVRAPDPFVSLLGVIDVPHKHKGGPGRGHKGEKMARFSATMDGDIYSCMKNLEGTFSSRLTAACRLYLRALESKSGHT